MPEWSDLSFNDFLTGLWFAVFGVIGWIGSRVGARKAPPPPSSTVEVAGALINTKQVGALIDQIGLNTVMAKELKMCLHELEKAVRQNTEAGQELREQAERLSRDMQDLSRELARGTGRR